MAKKKLGKKRAKKPETPEHKPVTLVFVGVVDNSGWNQKSRKAYAWLELDHPEQILEAEDASTRSDRCHIYAKPLQRGASPGGVYEIPTTETGSVLVNSGVYLGTYADLDRVSLWQTEHHATRRAFEAEGKATKELKQRHDLRRLEPWRTAYQRANPAAKAQILAMVVKAVTAPRELK